MNDTQNDTNKSVGEKVCCVSRIFRQNQQRNAPSSLVRLALLFFFTSNTITNTSRSKQQTPPAAAPMMIYMVTEPEKEEEECCMMAPTVVPVVPVVPVVTNTAGDNTRTAKAFGRPTEP